MGTDDDLRLFGHVITPFRFFVYNAIAIFCTSSFAVLKRRKRQSRSDMLRTMGVGLLFGWLQAGLGTAYAIARFPMFGVYGYFGLQVLFWFHMVSMGLGKLRGKIFRILITYPACIHATSSFFAMMVLPVWAYLIESPWIFLAPLAVGLCGLYFSMVNFTKIRALTIDDTNISGLQKVAEGNWYAFDPNRDEPPLTIFQITDPHLGPFMSVDRLRHVCEVAVSSQPDLILLTGDYFTIESQFADRALAEALFPLKSYRHGHVVACIGNHDYECYEKTVEELREVGILLLVDAELVVQTRVGPVQIIGADFVWTNRKNHIRGLLDRIPRRPDTFRLVLLHNPSVFKHIPDGDADLVLSGHYHGGQIGCLCPCCTCSIFSLTRMVGLPVPADGYWGLGRNRLYVHRGTGFYGFPMRIGIPGEEGVLEVYIHRDEETSDSDIPELTIDLDKIIGISSDDGEEAEGRDDDGRGGGGGDRRKRPGRHHGAGSRVHRPGPRMVLGDSRSSYDERFYSVEDAGRGGSGRGARKQSQRSAASDDRDFEDYSADTDRYDGVAGPSGGARVKAWRNKRNGYQRGGGGSGSGGSGRGGGGGGHSMRGKRDGDRPQQGSDSDW